MVAADYYNKTVEYDDAGHRQYGPSYSGLTLEDGVVLVIMMVEHSSDLPSISCDNLTTTRLCYAAVLRPSSSLVKRHLNYGNDSMTSMKKGTPTIVIMVVNYRSAVADACRRLLCT